MAYTSTHRSRGSRIRQWFLLFHRIHPPVFCEMQPRSRSPAGRDNEAGQPPAKSARSSRSASPRRVSPTQPNANGCPSPAVSPPAEQPKTTPAANVDSCYGHESKTMTIYRECLTPAEANPPSASGHRLAKPQSGPTSPGSLLGFYRFIGHRLQKL